MNLLEVDNISVSLGDMKILKSLSFEIREREIVSILGGNGAGKTTTLKTISGLIKPKKGNILFKGDSLYDNSPSDIVKKGIVQVPEGRILFNRMTVRENLEMGSYLSEPKKRRRESLDRVFSLFPILRKRDGQLAGTLSGGQQQMLAIGRGLMAMPKLLMLDEPSLGLGPIIVRDIFRTFDSLNRAGITMLLVEQNVQISLALCDRGYVLENGEITIQGRGEELMRNENIKVFYLGL